MRGALDDGGAFHAQQRIIPAYAGSTVRGQTCQVLRQDHPRVCGEHESFESFSDLTRGSSPRMRGALSVVCKLQTTHRIIPAYAGSTRSPLFSRGISQDHPRVCGEHFGQSMVPYHAAGSSPRMRGALELLKDHPEQAGIIPAYAGSTLASSVL